MKACLFKFFSRTVIPFEKVSFNYCRSSGPGGQAVNKQNTKCELRFIVDQAEWLDDYQKIRIKQMYNNKMNKEGELIITAQEHRTQEKNTESAKSKLVEMIEKASVIEKERVVEPFVMDEEEKEIRMTKKRTSSRLKSIRKGMDF